MKILWLALGTAALLSVFSCAAQDAGDGDLNSLLGSPAQNAPETTVPPTATPNSGPAAAPEGSAGAALAPAAGTDKPAVAATEESPQATAAIPLKTDSEAGSAHARNRLVEEIIVTAQKREENLQDVPIAISAFSGDNLEARGIDDPKALERITPGMSYSGFVGYSIIYLRGVGTDVFVPSADTSVATYIDGVYLPFAHSLAQDFVKLERIEVLKGPQGTLFGRNTTGGAINIITKKPADEFQSSIDVSRGSFNAMTAKAFVTGPLIKNVDGSLSVIYDQTDPYEKAAHGAPVQSLATDFTRGINAKLKWQPLEELSGSANVLATSFNGTGTIDNANLQTKPVGLILGIQPVGRYQVGSDQRNYLSAHNVLGYGEMDWKPQLFDMKLLGSYQKVRTNTVYDYDGSAENIAYFNPTNQYLRDVTSELQLLSKKDGLFPNWLTLTSGLYYLHSSGGFDPVFFAAVDLSHLSSLPIPSALQGLTGALQPVFNSFAAAAAQLPVPLPTSGADLELHGVVATRAYAGYLQTTVTPFDWFDFTLGGRYQIEHRGVTKASSSLVTTGAPITLFDFPLAHTTTYNFAPKVTFDFKPVEDQLLYLSWQKGFKSGTYNVVEIYTAPSYVRPEKVTAIEIGNKGTILDGTLRYTLAAFQTKIDDLQTLIVSLQSGGAVSLANAAQAAIKGAEFDVTWQMFPVRLPGFALNLSGAYLNGRYKSFPDGPGFDTTTGLFFGPGSLTGQPGRDFSGNRAVRAPKFSGNLAPGYSFDAPGGSLELGLDVYYTSGFFYDTQNTTTQPAYFSLGAHAGYLYEPLNLRVTVYGKNLTDAYYFQNKFATDFGINASYAAPIQLGIRLSWTFR